MFLLSNGSGYIGINDNKPTTVSCIKKALAFSEEQKAINYKENLKNTLKKFDWQVVELEDESKDSDSEVEEYIYVQTDLEKSNFDIVEFFSNTIKTISQLRAYSSNMKFLEQEYNKKILDVRHYKRDIKTKLSAIQLQRLEKFEIQLERERYECKSNRIIAEICLTDLNRLENINYIEAIKNVKESEYKPEILTYEMLDEIVGKKRTAKVSVV